MVRGDMVAGLREGVALVPATVADELGLHDGDVVGLGGIDLIVSDVLRPADPGLLVTTADLERIEPGAPLAGCGRGPGPTRRRSR